MTGKKRADSTSTNDDRPHEDRIRERYLELGADSTTVGLIVDPTNQHAWILSDRPERVRP